MRMDLLKLLMDHCKTDPEAVQEEVISGCKLSITQIRDKLYLLGNILYEDLDSRIYVVSVRAGLFNMSNAVVALQLCDDNLFVKGYAKEGLVKQNISDQAIRRIADLAKGKPVSDTSKPSKILPMLLAVVGIVAFISIRGCVTSNTGPHDVEQSLQHPSNETNYAETIGATETQEPTEDPAFVAEVEQTLIATKEYNEAVELFNLRVAEYNESVLLTCIDNINGLPTELEFLTVESESYEDIITVVQGDNSKEKIQSDTMQIGEMTAQVEMLTTIVQQITAPDGDWVCERLANIEGITGCQQVTESLNPDGLLGKEGGYFACVYFTHSSIVQKEVPGNSIVAKGTDAGGAVEVYPTLADAQARVEYLAGFDGTVLYSGSYAIVGTMVVRTSYKLTDEQQFILTHQITQALTATESVPPVS